MARACAVCGKTQQGGNNVSHANNKTSRVFKPNLQSINIMVDGAKTKALVCTRCIRSNKVTKVVSVKTVKTVKA